MKTPSKLLHELYEFEKSVGYSYKIKENAFLALIHSSWANENPASGLQSNERLEFMGDALLDFVLSIKLYNEKPHSSEGEMSRLRSLIVCESSLAQAAVSLSLGNRLLMGRGEELTGGRSRPSILADSLEAVFGGIFLDGGLEAASEVISRLLDKAYRLAVSGEGKTDWKTLLQEKLQKNGSVKITYRVVEESGPDHAKLFKVVVQSDGVDLGSGSGSSKKEAERDAARQALCDGTAELP